MIFVSGDLFLVFSSSSSILVVHSSGVMCLMSFVSEWNTTTSAFSFSVPMELIASSIVYAVIFLVVYFDHLWGAMCFYVRCSDHDKGGFGSFSFFLYRFPLFWLVSTFYSSPRRAWVFYYDD
jgi:hypothetical protein